LKRTDDSAPCTALFRWLATLAAMLVALALLPPPTHAQLPGFPAATDAQAQDEAAPDQPEPIPLLEIPTQAAADLAEARRRQARPWIKDAIGLGASRLPRLEAALHGQRQGLEADFPAFQLEDLQRREERLRELEQQLVPVRRDLAAAALQLERDLRDLARLSARWAQTLEQAEPDMPPDLLARVRETVAAVQAAHRNLQDEQALVLSLQSRMADLATAIDELREQYATAGGQAIRRLFRRDSAPLWSREFWLASVASFAPEANRHFREEHQRLSLYLREHARAVLAHAALAIALVLGLFAARAQVGQLSGTDHALGAKRAVFEMPIVTGLLLGFLASPWFYPSAPSAFSALLGIASAPVLYLFMRGLVEREVFPLFRLIIAFYVVDQLRRATAGLPGVNRLFLLAEGLLILFFILRFGIRWADRPADLPRTTGTTIALLIGRAMLLVAAAVLLAGSAGYAAFADFLLRASLASAFIAITLYALSRAIGGVVHALLYVPPLSFAAGVRRHRDEIAARSRYWLSWGAVAGWLLFTLQAFGVLPLALSWMQAWWDAVWEIGNLQVSMSSMILFAFILGASYLLSRLVQFLLEEELFSRVQLDRGLPHAVSTTIHYAILLLGFMLALTASGIDMTRFAIVAGALTVGIGFGLQNIVNNFVSGLIVLFERPVKVGDTIQMGDVTGRVLQIGIRATIIESTAGASVIIPNGKLISDQVTNWTRAGHMRQISVPVIAKADRGVDAIKALLLDVARENDKIADLPQPEVLLQKRNIDTLEFELRVWTHDLDAWLTIRSDLTAAADTALRATASGNPPPD